MHAVRFAAALILLAACLHSAGARAQNPPNFVECSISPAGNLTCNSFAGGSCTTVNPYSKTCTGGGASAWCAKDTRGRVSCTPAGSAPVCYVENETAKCYARSVKHLLEWTPPVFAVGDAVVNTSKMGYPRFTPAALVPVAQLLAACESHAASEAT